MAKQTLFEAEAILSVNSTAMFAGIDRDVKEAKARIERAFGSIVTPTMGGGGGGGRGAASGYFAENMAYARLERSAGEYTAAISRLNNMLNNYTLTSMQAAKAEDLRDRIITKQIKNQANLQKQLASNTKGASGSPVVGNPYGSTDKATNAMFRQEMALARGEKAAGEYAAAEARLNAILANRKITTDQLIRAQNELASVQRRANPTSGGPGQRSAVNPFADEMAQVRLLRNTHDYAGALLRVDQMLKLQLSTRQRLSAETLRANIVERQSLFNTQGNLTPGARRANAATQNASFAIQDFVTVLSMGGGMTRALASASNNVAFMASMMGTAGGAAIGLGATLAAVFVPALVKAALGVKDLGMVTKEAEERLKSLGAALEQVAQRYDMFQDAKEMSDKGDAQGVLDSTKTTQKKLDREQQIYDTALEESVGARGGAAAKTYEALGAFGGMLGESMEQFQQAVASGKFTSADMRAFASGPTANFVTGASDALNALADEIDKINEPSKKSAAEIQKLQEQLKILGEALLEAWKLPAEGFKDNLDPFGDKDFADFAEQKKKEAKIETDALNKSLPAQRNIFERFFPKEAEIEKIKKEFSDAFGATLSPEQQALMDFQIAQVKQPPAAQITGQMGGSAFAQQLTEQLVKSDPQTKLVDFASKQVGLQEKMLTSLQAAEKKLDDLDKSPFQNN